MVDASIQRFRELTEVNEPLTSKYRHNFNTTKYKSLPADVRLHAATTCDGLLFGILYCHAYSQVCDCQRQFARWEDGRQSDLPIFGGIQGPEFTRLLLEIEGIFHRGLQKLHSCDTGILDIENTSWHNEFNT